MIEKEKKEPEVDLSALWEDPEQENNKLSIIDILNLVGIIIIILLLLLKK